MKLAIVGAGAAGVAAAHTALAAGAEVTVYHAAPGTSALYSGVLDFDPRASAKATAQSAELGAVAEALGCWRLGPCVIATAQGNARSADGRDSALLDLAPLAGKRVAVADLERDDWDASLLAKSYAASAWAKRTGTIFEALPVAGLRSGSERRVAPYDLAKLHDRSDRVDFLAAALQAAGRPDAWLLGPWLGIAEPTARVLTERLGVAVGECASQPGGAAGARFELGRDRLFQNSPLRLERTRVTRLARHPAGYALHAGDRQLNDAAAVVLAIGGVAAGGIVLADALGERAAGFRLSLEAPVTLELDRHDAEVSSLAALDFVARGVAILERVGIAADDSGAARGAPGLFVAGDVLAARPRGVLTAAISGAIAAQSALAYLAARAA